MGISTNKYLTVRSDVILTPDITSVIMLLDPFFQSLPSEVTSGFRSSIAQLSLIKNYAIKTGLDKIYPKGMISTLDIKDEEGNYGWQIMWSDLLGLKGVIINPPRSCEMLLGENKGKLYNASPHSTGKAFDIAGAEQVRDIILNASHSIIHNISQVLLEHQNHCVHTGVI